MDSVLIGLSVVLFVIAVVLCLSIVGSLAVLLMVVHRLTAANDVLNSKIVVLAEKEVGDLRLERGRGGTGRVHVSRHASVSDADDKPAQEGTVVPSMIPMPSWGG
jgi:hypothetical protein